MTDRRRAQVAAVPGAPGGGDGDGPTPPWEERSALLVIVHGDHRALGRRLVATGASPLRIGSTTGGNVVAEGELGFQDTVARASFEHARDGWVCTRVHGTDAPLRVGGVPVESRVRLTHGARIRLGPLWLEWIDSRDPDAAYHDVIYRLTRYDAITGLFHERGLHDYLAGRRARHAVVELAFDRPLDADALRDAARALAASREDGEVLAVTRTGSFALAVPTADVSRALSRGRTIAAAWTGNGLARVRPRPADRTDS